MESTQNEYEYELLVPEGFYDANKKVTTIDGVQVRTIYVSNVPPQAKWLEMLRVFSEFGNIKKLYLKTETFRTFAFVTYYNPCSAVLALQHRGVYILGKKVYIAIADSWHQPIENPDGTLVWTKQRRKKKKEEEESIDENFYEAAESEQVVEDKQGLGDSIDVLNDDCLIHVFSFLNYSQRFSIERVCKRWQEINDIMWKGINSLDFNSPSMLCIPLNMITLECLLKRCNANLRTLNLCVKNHLLDAKAITFIAKYCQNIEELYISQLPINQRCIPHLGKYCTRLKKVEFIGCKYFTDSDLIKWLSGSQTLISITITKTETFNGTSLTSLTSPLECLNLNHCKNLFLTAVIQCLVQNSSTLKHLSLDACVCLRPCDVSSIVESVPNLNTLSLSEWFPFFDKESLLPLGNLAHLQELNLIQSRYVSDQVVAAIVEGCKELTLINLSGCRCGEGVTLTPEGVSILGNLPKLTSLDISYLIQTNDICLKKLTAKSTHLKFIKCIGCPGLTDSSCTQVVSLCNELESFNLSGNQWVTNETVQTALDSVKLCTNRKPLELIVGGTSVNITSNDDRVIINQKDFCRFYLRPDFIENLILELPSSDEDELDVDE